MAAKPDALFIAATGGPAVLPQATLLDKGYKGKLYQTHGVATNEFIRIGGAKVEGTLMAGRRRPAGEQPDQGRRARLLTTRSSAPARP